MDEGIPIIHMSVGTRMVTDYGVIQPLIAKMAKRNQAIVAAGSNHGKYTIPACLGGVFGVIADEALSGDACLPLSRQAHPYLIKASSRHALNSESIYAYMTPICNSYAAPTVTAAIHRLLAGYEPFSLTMPRIHRLLEGNQSMPFFRQPDFIESACLVNPNNYPILRQHLFFDCVKEHNGSTWPEEASGGDVILLPVKGKPPNIPPRCGNLVYCGELPVSHPIWRQDALVWSECAYKAALSQSSRPGPSEGNKVDCPVVRVFGQGLEPLDLTCRLRAMFLIEGYQCIGISNTPYAYLYGLIYAPYRINVNSFIASTSRWYESDIIIVYDDESCELVGNDKSHKIVGYDGPCGFVVDIVAKRMPANEDEFYVLFVADVGNYKPERADNVYSIPYHVTDQVVSTVYDAIVSCFPSED